MCSIAGVTTVADSAIAGHTAVAVVNSGDHANIVGMAGGVGIGSGESGSNLLDDDNNNDIDDDFCHAFCITEVMQR